MEHDDPRGVPVVHRGRVFLGTGASPGSSPDQGTTYGAGWASVGIELVTASGSSLGTLVSNSTIGPGALCDAEVELVTFLG